MCDILPHTAFWSHLTHDVDQSGGKKTQQQTKKKNPNLKIYYVY